MSGVGLFYPREMARIRGANWRGLICIDRNRDGEAFFVVVDQGGDVDEVRRKRSHFKERGAWQDRHWKRHD